MRWGALTMKRGCGASVMAVPPINMHNGSTHMCLFWAENTLIASCGTSTRGTACS